MCLGYKVGQESVEQRLEFFKANESEYVEKINILKTELYVRDELIKELRKILELSKNEKDAVQKEKANIQLSVDTLEYASERTQRIIDSHIIYKCKSGLRYNSVPPPIIGKFAPPSKDFPFTDLDECVKKSEDVSTKLSLVR